MKRQSLAFALAAFALTASASWYWPFGDDTVKKHVPRISELMEPASLLIDEATDLADDGKSSEAIEKYRKALTELDRIELENPDRAKGMEFATLRNKREYVNAAIDSLLLGQVKDNAKAVAVSDTTELEKKLAAERAAKQGKVGGEGAAATGRRSGGEGAAATKKDGTKNGGRDEAIRLIKDGDYDGAMKVIDAILAEKPQSAMALNLKATVLAKTGQAKAAADTLVLAVKYNPQSHFAYYNLALLSLEQNPAKKDAARLYYEKGRAAGGPVNPQIEGALK